MRKNYLLFLIALFQNFYSSAQLSTYSFGQSGGIYTPITGGTILGSTSNNDEFFVDPSNLSGSSFITTGIGFPIGFNFRYNGQVFDRFGVHTNGWISLGQFSLLQSVNMGSNSPFETKTPLSSGTSITPEQLRNRISAVGYDLAGQTGSEISFQTTGSAPYRSLIVQWKNYRSAGQSGQSYNFQIRLNETSNAIYLIYGTMTFTSTFATFNAAAEVGLGGISNTDFNNRSTLTTNWNATSPGTASNNSCLLRGTAPNSGLNFLWVPQVLNTPEFEVSNQIKIYPNPASEYIIIENQNFKDSPLTIEIYNCLGKRVLEQSFLSDDQKLINIQNLTKGFYLLRMVKKDEIQVSKFLVN